MRAPRAGGAGLTAPSTRGCPDGHFESEDFGCLLGIDGAGFNFFHHFWIPLYRLRGLQWHEAG